MAYRIAADGCAFNRYFCTMPTVSLGRALADQNLFARHFRGPSWASWKAFLGRCLPSLRSRRPRRLPRADRADDVAYGAVHRGGGDRRPAWRQVRTLALIAVYLACFRDYTPYLAPGEVATVGVLAVDKGQARTIFRLVLGLLKAVPMLEPLIVRRDAETIELSNGVHIEIATASFRSTRG